MFEATDVIAIAISFISFVVSLFAYHITRENLSLNAFMNALEIWGSNEARESRRYIRENFPDYTKEEDLDGEIVELQIKNGEQSKSVSRKVKELTVEDRKHFEKLAVGTDRIGFMLFEMKNLPKDFKKAYLQWLHDSFCAVWNRVAPHVNKEREERNFAPYFEKLAYLAYYIASKQRKSNIILLDPKKMEEASQKYKELWDC